MKRLMIGLVFCFACSYVSAQTSNFINVRGELNGKPWTYKLPITPDQLEATKTKLTYVSRGDLGAWDFVKADLTLDNNYHDLVLTNAMPTNASIAVVRFNLKCDTAEMELRLRKKGITGGVNSRRWSNQDTTAFSLFPVIEIEVDEMRTMQYLATTNGAWTTLKVAVIGYFTTD